MWHLLVSLLGQSFHAQVLNLAQTVVIVRCPRVHPIHRRGALLVLPQDLVSVDLEVFSNATCTAHWLVRILGLSWRLHG